MKISADGVEGILIWCADGCYRFRVYTDSHDFTDYDLLHGDLGVTITDATATFYSDDQGNRLDYSPIVLGIT
jgi:hypothetical protein